MTCSAETLLAADTVRAGYGQREVLRGVSLGLRRGEVVGLLGPNGSGKTTMLKVLCGALPPISGNVTLVGSLLATLSSTERAKRVAYVPQSEEHAFDFTVRELTLMGRFAYADGLFETLADREAADQAMEAADCLDLADRPISTLSGGEAQRALIARALAQASPVVLCDEPTTHLDPRHQRDVSQLLRRLASEGRGIVVTTHDLNMAAATCDRVVLLKDGQIEFEGTLGPDSLEPLAHVFDVRFATLQGHLWTIAD